MIIFIEGCYCFQNETGLFSLYRCTITLCAKFPSLSQAVEKDDETFEEDAYVKEAKTLHELESEDETELRIFYFYFSISIPGPSSLSSLC